MRAPLLTFLLAVAVQGANAQTAQPSQGPCEEPVPEAQIAAPADAPLLVSVKTKWVEGFKHALEVYVGVENVSDRVVRAYATRDSSADAEKRYCAFYSAPAAGKVLRRGQTHGMSTWRTFDPATSAPLKRSLDFVEFADGTTWGPDVCQSAEWLAGQRAGAGEVAVKLRQVFADGGAAAVVEALKSNFCVSAPRTDHRGRVLETDFQIKNDFPDIAPPEDRPAVWREGFCAGVRAYVRRLRRAVQEWGEEEIETALKRPYDASGAGAP